MHTRRNFITKSSLTFGAITFLKPLQSIAGSTSTTSDSTLTILFSNGLSGTWSNDDQAGGIASIKLAVQQIRRQGKNVLLLDSGNILAANSTKNIEHLHYFKTLKETGYDAITPGVTDMQHGPEYFSKLVNRSRVNAVATNLAENDNLLSYRVIRKGRLKIGIIGIGGDEQLTTERFHCIIHQLNERALVLRKKHRCQLVVCLSHLPLNNQNKDRDNIRLAEASSDIDLIISNNDNRFTYNTHSVKNISGNDVLLSHAGNKGSMLGKLEISFNDSGEKTAITTEQIFTGLTYKNSVAAFRNHLSAQLA